MQSFLEEPTFDFIDVGVTGFKGRGKVKADRMPATLDYSLIFAFS